MRESRYNVWVRHDERDYVFNTLSGALLRMRRSERAALDGFLRGDGAADCPPGVIANLIAGRMVIRDDVDEVDRLARRYEASREDRSRFALTIVTSLGCNFDCPYCFEAKHDSIVDDDVKRAILDVVDDQIDGGITALSVTWFGGEPLVGRRPLMALSDEFIVRCDAHGVDYAAHIVTNGFLLTEATCRRLRERRVRSAQVGLDGPPDVHNRMRPMRSGRGSFDTILRNLRHAVDYLDVTVRVNLDQGNADRAQELFEILADAGLSGRLTVYPGQIIGTAENPTAPSASYAGCLTNRAFADAELRFLETARRYGLAPAKLPTAVGAPCTAVRANELVVGSAGELYKCWDSVGDDNEIIGHISDYANVNGRLAKWLRYDPFGDDECRSCIALPVCMGGCAHHAFDEQQYENRCGTFRHTCTERVLDFVRLAEQEPADLIPVVRRRSRPVAGAAPEPAYSGGPRAADGA